MTLNVNDFIHTKSLLFGMAIIIFVRFIRSESDHKIILKS